MLELELEFGAVVRAGFGVVGVVVIRESQMRRRQKLEVGNREMRCRMWSPKDGV